jgi:two-component system chemotaxis response regulator CheB
MADEQRQGLKLPQMTAAFDVVALAASAGGLRAIEQVLAALPADFPAAIVVVQHLDPRHRSLMASILSRHTALTVQEAREGDRLRPGMVFIAPPNRHLLVNPDGSLSLSQSELVHFVRPSADLLFESVAASFKERAIAVVLTGTGSDGAMGVQAIKKMGGRSSPRIRPALSSPACRPPPSRPAWSISSSPYPRSRPRSSRW